MSSGDIGFFKPTEEPVGLEQSPGMRLKRPYGVYWVNSRGVAVPLSKRGFHLRKTALAFIRAQMLDGSSHDFNHHTRYYIRDMSLPWNPDSLYCWTPVTERPRDQWAPSY